MVYQPTSLETVCIPVTSYAQYGWTALHLSSLEGHVDVVCILLEAHVQVNQRMKVIYVVICSSICSHVSFHLSLPLLLSFFLHSSLTSFVCQLCLHMFGNYRYFQALSIFLEGVPFLIIIGPAQCPTFCSIH